jgi:hypothetical protein
MSLKNIFSREKELSLSYFCQQFTCRYFYSKKIWLLLSLNSEVEFVNWNSRARVEDEIKSNGLKEAHLVYLQVEKRILSIS